MEFKMNWIYFEDEKTRSRCRESLALLSRRIVQAEYERQVLLSYLSKLTFTFTEDDEVNGPNLSAEETLSKELFLRHRRCPHRAVFEPQAGFFVILSREMSLYYEIEKEEKRGTVQKLWSSSLLQIELDTHNVIRL